MNLDKIKRGQVWIANLEPIKGHEQGKRRPVLVIQNNIANKNSPCVTITPITSYTGGKIYPTEVLIESPEGGLDSDSLIMASQIRTLDKKKRLDKHIGQVKKESLKEVEQAMKIHLGFVELY